MNDIGANIEAIRKEKGIKQEVLAQMLGVTQGTYSGYLTQNKDLKYGRILEIANILNVNVVDLITYPEKFVPESDACLKCKEKDEIIRNLNDFISVLTKKKKVV
jgi:transcriptional regulator with XRE-family HTH domain